MRERDITMVSTQCLRDVIIELNAEVLAHKTNVVITAEFPLCQYIHQCGHGHHEVMLLLLSVKGQSRVTSHKKQRTP